MILLFAGGVMTGDAYLFGRLGGFSGGVSLAEPLLPASSLTRNTRNTLKYIPSDSTGQDYRNATTKKMYVLELCVAPRQETSRPQEPPTPTQNTTDKPLLHSTLRRAGTPGTVRVAAAHASPLHQPQPQDSSTRTYNIVKLHIYTETA